MRKIGLDVGDKTIGVAVSDPLGITAQGITTIERVGIRKDTTKILEMIDEHDCDTVVVGLPLSMSGSDSEQTQAHLESKVEKLSRNFDTVTGIDILIDLANREKPNLSVTVKQKNIADAYATIDNTELLTAMDLALDKLEQQLRKAKEKKIDEHKKS